MLNTYIQVNPDVTKCFDDSSTYEQHEERKKDKIHLHLACDQNRQDFMAYLVKRVNQSFLVHTILCQEI